MSYEGLKTTIEKLNNELKSEPVGGTGVYGLMNKIQVPFKYKLKNEHGVPKYLFCVFFKWVSLRQYSSLYVDKTPLFYSTEPYLRLPLY